MNLQAPVVELDLLPMVPPAPVTFSTMICWPSACDTHGGRKPTGIDAIEYAREVVSLGAGEILLTSMDRDGTKSGFDIALTRSVTEAVNVPVIASGGVGTLDHLVEGIRDGGATAVLAASIFHFGEFSIAEAKTYMARHGVAIRLDGIAATEAVA